MLDQKDYAHDVSMGSYHKAEFCELVGLFILNELVDDKKIDKINCSLYCDDGLLIVSGV